MEQKTMMIKAVDPDSGVFEGYAAVFGVVDDTGDRIDQGAFSKTLSENGDRIKLLWQHDQTEPIGKPLELAQDSHGLRIKGKISKTRRGNDALELLRSDPGSLGLSIGFDTIKSTREGAVRVLKEVKLWEVSLVTWPANKLAQITDVKSGRLEVEPPVNELMRLLSPIRSEISSIKRGWS